MLTSGGVGALLRSTSNDAEPPVLQVVEICRYSLDDKWMSQSKEKDRPALGDAFDVTVSDGVHKLKCALSTTLNGRVYRGWLRPVVAVRVADWRLVVDERIEGASSGAPIVVLTELEAVRVGDADTDSAFPQPLPGIVNLREDEDELQVLPDALASAAEAQARQTGPLPLLGVRQHYLRLESDEVLLTGRWTQGADDDHVRGGAAPLPAAELCPRLCNANEDRRPRTADESAARVLSDVQPRRPGPLVSKGPPPPLIGRVKRVGPLLNFGGLHEPTALGFPTKFTFWLWDGTSEAGLPVTVWNRKCEELYTKVCRASIVHVSGYRLGIWKTGFEEGQHEWRANVNPSKPDGKVVTVTTGEIGEAWGQSEARRRLPELPEARGATRSYLQTQARLRAVEASEAAEAERTAAEDARVAPRPSEDRPPSRLSHLRVEGGVDPLREQHRRV